jgi:hypothetical protein
MTISATARRARDGALGALGVRRFSPVAVAAQPPSPGAQIGVGVPLVVSGVLRKRVAAEGPAALSRLS